MQIQCHWQHQKPREGTNREVGLSFFWATENHISYCDLSWNCLERLNLGVCFCTSAFLQCFGFVWSTSYFQTALKYTDSNCCFMVNSYISFHLNAYLLQTSISHFWFRDAGVQSFILLSMCLHLIQVVRIWQLVFLNASKLNYPLLTTETLFPNRFFCVFSACRQRMPDIIADVSPRGYGSTVLYLHFW